MFMNTKQVYFIAVFERRMRTGCHILSGHVSEKRLRRIAYGPIEHSNTHPLETVTSFQVSCHSPVKLDQ